jgi:hypothetical protein
VRVLDLYAGLGGWSKPARERGHQVTTVDLDPRFGTDIVADVFDLTAAALGGRGAFDLILASPPCEKFSVMTIGRNWNRDNTPKTEVAATALRLVEHTRALIEALAPAFYVIENPRGKLRALPALADLERRTVTYCRLGMPYMKPTDLWGGFPPSLVLPEACKPNRPDRLAKPRGNSGPTNSNIGHSLDHIAAPRGSRTGVQRSPQTDHIGTATGVPGGNPSAYKKARRDVQDGLLTGRTMPPGTKRTKFRGGVLEEIARYPSWSAERKNLSAILAEIPRALALLVIEAAERDLAAGARPVPTMLWALA